MAYRKFVDDTILFRSRRKEKAKETFDFVVKTCGKHYFLGEQVNNSTLKPDWALGLGWSHAMFIIVLENYMVNRYMSPINHIIFHPLII